MLPYPRSLPRPLASFGVSLVVQALGGPRQFVSVASSTALRLARHSELTFDDQIPILLSNLRSREFQSNCFTSPCLPNMRSVACYMRELIAPSQQHGRVCTRQSPAGGSRRFPDTSSSSIERQADDSRESWLHHGTRSSLRSSARYLSTLFRTQLHAPRQPRPLLHYLLRSVSS